MKIVLGIINFLALLGAIIWWILSPDWEPAVTSIGLFGGLIAQIFTNDEIKNRFKIYSKKDSHNYQSNRDLKVTDNKKIQKNKNGSENYQAEVIVVKKGMTYEETRNIAMDVYKANMMQFKTIAAEEANNRAEEITEKILKKISESNLSAFAEFQKPGMQDALFRTQKEYAMSGDKELGDLLVDIISDRANAKDRNMLQIVLDESLNVAPKITIEQLDTLTLNFLLIKTRRLNVLNYELLKAYFIKSIFPFVDNLVGEPKHYNFLEYLRCGQIRAGSFGKLEANLRKTYKGLFSKGFTMEEVITEFGDISKLNGLIIPCFHDRLKFQISVMDDEVLENKMTELKIDDTLKPKIKSFFEKTTMQPNEIKSQLENFDNRMKKIFDIWDNSYFKNFDLSSMGIAIAHANYRRRTNETMDLTIWIK